VVWFDEGIINGSAPHGEKGLDALAELGVKTVVCVDGAKPEVEAAEARGMRYVHLPIGYDSIPDQRVAELAKAVETLPKPVYVHCFHGRHRSPAAVAAAMVALGRMEPDQAVEKMRGCGTSEKYTGLYKAAAEARLLTPEEIQAATDQFVAYETVDGFVGLMAEITRVEDHLKAMRRAGWQPPTDHPDLVLKNEAEQMAILLRQAGETEHSRNSDATFRELMRASHAAAEQLLSAAKQEDVRKIEDAWNALDRSCSACHTQYRH
jgi:protein tyrosine phosphatase (PTP) superfamily phosphohydrolase (DUF442 family)